MSMCYWCRNNTYCQATEKAKYKAVNDGEMYCISFNPVALPVISMGRTSPPWVNEEKAVTRRDWTRSTFIKFKKDAYYLALSRQRLFGGQPIGIGRMTADPFKQQLNMMVDEDYSLEGFEYLDQRYNSIEDEMDVSPLWDAFVRWESSFDVMTVVPFEIVEVFPGMKDKYSTDEEIIRCVKALVKVIG